MTYSGLTEWRKVMLRLGEQHVDECANCQNAIRTFVTCYVEAVRREVGDD